MSSCTIKMKVKIVEEISIKEYSRIRAVQCNYSNNFSNNKTTKGQEEVMLQEHLAQTEDLLLVFKTIHLLKETPIMEI